MDVQTIAYELANERRELIDSLLVEYLIDELKIVALYEGVIKIQPYIKTLEYPDKTVVEYKGVPIFCVFRPELGQIKGSYGVTKYKMVCQYSRFWKEG